MRRLTVPSGATGGPGTGRITYQVDNAVWQALHLISEVFRNPSADLKITIEPRLVSPFGVTEWDICLAPSGEHIEVKFNLKRNDVEEWLDRVGLASADQQGVRIYKLAYNKGTPPILSSVENLRRIARETRDDVEKFTSLVAGEQIIEADNVLNRLGQNAHTILQNLKIEQLPEPVLQRNISVICQLLAGTNGPQFYRFLYDELSHGISERMQFSVNELIERAGKACIVLNLSRAPMYSEYHPIVSATLFLLQSCVTGLPINVISHAIDSDRKSLEAQMRPLIEAGRILEQNDCWFNLPPPERMQHPHGNDILARGLDVLLHYLDNPPNSEEAIAQIHNVVALSKACVLVRPRSVVFVFPLLDKLLKCSGDIYLVLELATLSISAGKAIENRTHDEAAAVARSLVCGVSWAYQRMPGHLDDARNAYNDSRDIAEGIDDRVTLAFISKCLGRLCRLEAEELDDDLKKSKLLESEHLLKEAVELFTDLPEAPFKAHEIADSYSLLARTYLVAREFDKCGQAMRIAFNKIENLQSKEFADLMILNGDLELSRRNYASARSAYNKSLELKLGESLNSSEIRARAVRQRGLSYLGSRKLVEAKRDLEQAAAIWDRLGQRENSASARLEAMQIDQKLPDQALQLLKKEAASVKLAVAELHARRISERASRRAHVASREKPNKNYFESLLREAKRLKAIQNLNE